MSVQLFLEKPLDPSEIYKLAETTDLLYRKLRNVGYARKHADIILPDDHTAIQAAAIRIIKATPIGVHPARDINKRNLAVLRIVTTSLRRAICLGSDGQVYPALRGHLFEDGRFIPTATNLATRFMLFSAKRDGTKLSRVAVLRPTLEYIA